MNIKRASVSKNPESRLPWLAVLVTVLVVTVILWRLQPSYLVRSASNVANAIKDDNPKGLYKLMTTNEKSALGITESQFEASWIQIYRPILTNGDYLPGLDTETFGNPPHSGVAFYRFRLASGNEIAVGNVSMASEGGPAYSLSKDLLVFASIAYADIQKQPYSESKDHFKARVQFINSHKAQFEKLGVTGIYIPEKRKLSTWAELIEQYNGYLTN